VYNLPSFAFLLVNEIIRGGDFSQRSEEDRNSPDTVTRGERVDMFPRHKMIPNVEFIKDFEHLSRLAFLL
jgi:hypothetical protein